MDECVWCSKRIWFWQKWEWTDTTHCELRDGGWVCSDDCWDAATNDDVVDFNRIIQGGTQ